MIPFWAFRLNLNANNPKDYKIMSGFTSSRQELENSVSSQLVGNDIANLYSFIDKDK